MTWTKLGDNFTDRPEMFRASRSARMLLVEAYVWSNRMLTDGRVPEGVLRRVSDSDDVDADAKELTEAGLWEVDGQEFVLDWSDQEPAVEVRARQERQAEKQKRYRRRKELHAAGDHSECDPRFCKSVTGNAGGHVTSNVTGLVTPSRPVPSRPEGTGDRDRVAGARSAGATRVLRPAATDGQATPLADWTPYDIAVHPNDCGDGHHEVIVEPADYPDTVSDTTVSTYTNDQFAASLAHFRQVAHVVAEKLRTPATQLQARHGCEADPTGEKSECGVGDRYIDDVEPMLSVNVPAALIDAWLDHVIDALKAADPTLKEATPC